MKKLFTLFVLSASFLSQAQTANYATLSVCEQNSDGFAIFDLTMAIPQILGSQNPANYTVGFFFSQWDAQNNTNAISNPSSYTNIGPYYETLYSRVEISGNYAVGTLDLAVSEIPALNPYPGIVSCDDSSLDGQESFDLTQSGPTIYNNDPNLSISFFNSQTDATNDVNAIGTPQNYLNATNPETIYARVTEYGNYSSCFETTSFQISVIDCSADLDNDLVATGYEDVNGDGNLANDDTDNDLLPNFKDDDDDGDGILTADEDYNQNGDPTDDDTDGNGIPDYLDKHVSLAVSALEAAANSFSIFPNPATEEVHLQWNENLMVQSIFLFDLTGKQVKEIKPIGTLQEVNIGLSDLPPGLYFISVETTKGKSMEKLLVR